VDKWKVISQKSIYKARFFEVKEQEVLLPNNKKHVYSIVERRPTVNIFPLTNTHNLYLISQYRVMFGKRILEAVAGHVDENETSLAAAKRELREEVGMWASHWEEISRIEKSASVIKETSHLFLAYDLEKGIANPDAGEDIQLVKLPLKEAVARVMSGEINNSATMIGILLLDNLKRNKKL
jgi:8-oxo-dGTP pyrophosphatase MutT (NUDIX family)